MFDRYRRRKAEETARAKVDAWERAGDVDGLAELLRGGEQETVIRAAAALGRIGGREAIEALLAALDGARGDTRFHIVRSLGTIGGPIATDVLTGLLHDSEDVRTAAPALARIGGRRALTALTDALTDPNFPGSRAPLQDAVRRLIPVLRLPAGLLPGHLTRDAAAEVRRLVWAGDLDASHILLRQIRDGISSAEATSGMRWSGASYAGAAVDSVLSTVYRQEMVAHRSVGHNAQPFPLDGLHAVSPWLELANLEATLGTLPEDMEEPATPPSLGAQVDDPIVEVMIRLLRGSDDETAALRLDTLISLHRMNRLDSVADLGSTLNDRYWAVRLAAVAALRKMDAPEAIAVLRTKMDDQNQAVRRAAVAVAVRKDGHILRQAVRDPHDDVRAQAAMSAADLDDPQWADVLVPLLTDGERLTRMHAGEALHRWAWTGDPVQVAVSACSWDDVVAAGASAVGPLMRMFEETYRDHDPDKEPALRALERLVTEHGRAIPDHVLRAGADFEDFAGVLQRERDGDHLWAPRVDASRLRQVCREVLQARDSGRQSTAD
jgi:HEAT repeat protein